MKAAICENARQEAVRLLVPVALLAAIIPGVTAAEEADEDALRLEVRVAAGPGIAPEFEGASRYELVPYFETQVFYGPYYLKLNGPRARANLLPHQGINAGPMISYQRGRDDLSTAQVDRLDEIDGAVELGGFVEYENRHEDDPLSVERLRLSVRQDVTGNHNGALVSLRGVFQRRILRGTVLALTAGTTWASQDFTETFFSISRAESARSGLGAFDADSGFKDIGAGVSIDQFFSRNWSVGGRLNYTRLLGDAADSPVVDTAGSPDQLFATVVVAYRF